MSVIAEFRVPSESFLLGDSLRAAPEVVVELQRVVAHSEEELVPFFWVQYGDQETFDEMLHQDPTLEDIVVLDEFKRGTSYRGTWTKFAKGIAHAYMQEGAAILEATGQSDTWTLRMRFDNDESVSNFHRYCQREDIKFTLQQLYHPSQPMAGGQYGLEPTERETLVTAIQRGYYDVPRNVNMTDLAEELEATQQTLSERFRRAHAALIANTLVVSDEEWTTTGKNSP